MLILKRRPENHFFGRCIQRKTLKDVTVCLYRYPPHSNIPRHCHDEAYVSFVLKGGYTESSGAHDSDVLETDMGVLHPPGETHADEFHDREVVLLAVQFTPAWYEEAVGGGMHLARAKRSSLDMSRMARKLYVQLGYKHARSNVCAMGLAFELTAELLCRDVPDQNTCAARARDIALSSFRSPITLMTIAEQLQLNPSHVARAFKGQYGLTVCEFIRNARLNYATRRLSHSNDPIGIISVESGFYDQSHFTSQFRQAMGITPALYRKRLRNTDSSEIAESFGTSMDNHRPG